MAKKVSGEPRAAKQNKVLYRCITENAITATSHEYSRRFGPGQIVDLDEALGDGSKLRDNVRKGTFEMIDPPPALKVKERDDDDTDRP